MKIPKRGEKGFTLIELLIVVAILGVLAAVIIPNVGRFLGRGEEESRRVEFNTVRLGITAMMVENGIATIPNASNEWAADGTATKEMDEFPDTTSAWGSVANPTTGKLTDPTGVDYDDGDKPGYLLYAHDLTADTAQTGLVNTVSSNPLTYFYTCETDGTIRQFDNATDLTADHEFTY